MNAASLLLFFTGKNVLKTVSATLPTAKGSTIASARSVCSAVAAAACASQHGTCSSASRTLGAASLTRTRLSMLDCVTAASASVANSL